MPRVDNAVYELSMIFLALLSIGLLLFESAFSLSQDTRVVVSAIDTAILIVFAVDYFYHLLKSPQKFGYVKRHLPELIAIIPFSSIFRAARAVRLARLSKLLKVTRAFRASAWLFRFRSRIKSFFNTNGFQYVLLITIAVTLVGAASIRFFEGLTWADSLWWSFVTITTVGYGDLSPSTGGGRIVAAVIMLFGIGFLGMLTGTIATFFLTGMHSKCDSQVEDIRKRLKAFNDLSVEEVREISKVLVSLKEE